MLLRKLTHSLDKFGMGVSILCAIHCALLPILITTLPLLGAEFFANPLLEILIISLSFVIGVTSLSTSWQRHQNRLPVILMITGFASILAGHFWLPDSLEWLLLTAGGLTVACAHYVNWQLLRKCSVCNLPSKPYLKVKVGN